MPELKEWSHVLLLGPVFAVTLSINPRISRLHWSAGGEGTFQHWERECVQCNDVTVEAMLSHQWCHVGHSGFGAELYGKGHPQAIEFCPQTTAFLCNVTGAVMSRPHYITSGDRVSPTGQHQRGAQKFRRFPTLNWGQASLIKPGEIHQKHLQMA